MALTNDEITAQNFKDFYTAIFPYLSGSAHAGFTPVGTIISVMGTTAPQNYLACDGTAYNIADYPVLSAYIEEQFGTVNYFGGDGTTTFAVPDLRGEFLRGTGTNSHENQGSGSSVGVHQDGTNIPNIGAINASEKLYLQSKSSTSYTIAGNFDSRLSGSGTILVTPAGTTASTSDNYAYITTRPTNTSVLYCIASTNIYIDARFDYSTTEKVVGTWIDSKPLYQKTVQYTVPNTTTQGTIAEFTQTFASDVDMAYIAETTGQGIIQSNFNVTNSTLSGARIYVAGTTLKIQNTLPAWNGAKYYATIRYTKTTD